MILDRPIPLRALALIKCWVAMVNRLFLEKAIIMAGRILPSRKMKIAKYNNLNL